jgi:hypothetical protein
MHSKLETINVQLICVLIMLFCVALWQPKVKGKMKKYNYILMCGIALSGLIGCKSNTNDQGFTKRDYSIPPEDISNMSKASSYDVDLGNLVVSMPGKPDQVKLTKFIEGLGNLTMYQSMVVKSSLGGGVDGVYVAVICDYALLDGLHWNIKKGLDGAISGNFDDWHRQGLTYTVDSNQYLTVANHQGHEIKGSLSDSTKVVAYDVLVLAESNKPRAYVFVVLTTMSSDADAIAMMASIRTK